PRLRNLDRSARLVKLVHAAKLVLIERAGAEVCPERKEVASGCRRKSFPGRGSRDRVRGRCRRCLGTPGRPMSVPQAGHRGRALVPRLAGRHHHDRAMALTAWPSACQLHRRDVASSAPRTSDSSLAQAISGWTLPPRPQSVPAMTFSRPTPSAKRTMRSATSPGCSTSRITGAGIGLSRAPLGGPPKAALAGKVLECGLLPGLHLATLARRAAGLISCPDHAHQRVLNLGTCSAKLVLI